MKKPTAETERRNARKNSPEWHGLVKDAEAIISQLSNPELWTILYQDRDQFPEQLEFTPSDNAGLIPFSYAVLRAKNSATVCGLIGQWTKVAKAMGDWQQQHGLIGPKDGKPKIPPRYNPPGWMPVATEVRVYENHASTSQLEKGADAKKRVEAFGRKLNADLARSFVKVFATITDTSDLMEKMPATAEEYSKWKFPLGKLLEALAEPELLSIDRFLEECFSPLEESGFWMKLETQSDFWKGQASAIQRSLTTLLQAQTDSWLGMLLVKAYPSIASTAFKESFPEPFIDADCEDADDSFEIETDAAGFNMADSDGVIRFIHPYQAIKTVQGLIMELLESEIQSFGTIRLRHPHIQRRVSVTDPGGNPTLITLSRNGLFIGNDVTVTKGKRNATDSKKLTSITTEAKGSMPDWARRQFSHDVLVRLGKHELCRM